MVHSRAGDQMGAGMSVQADGAKMERVSEREVVVTRVFQAPVERVFQAWTTPDILKRWWAPKSSGVSFIACEPDVRTGGAYRFAFRHPSLEQPLEFFGRYLEVTPPTRLVWSNEEGEEGGQVTSVTFEDREGATLLTMRELYPSEATLDAAMANQSVSGFAETYAQLDALLAAG